MDIMEKANDLVELITKNDTLKENFKKDPVKVVKGLLAKVDLDKLNLDDETVEKLTAAVKGKLDIDKASALLGGLKKLF